MLAKIQNYDRRAQAQALFTNGEACIRAAEFLFDEGQKKHVLYEYGILLIHGVEVLLKSFILAKDFSISVDDFKNGKYKKDAHKILPLLKLAVARDDGKIISSSELQSIITILATEYAEGTVELRYPDRSGLRRFNLDTFKLLNRFLIDPLSDLFINFARHADPRFFWVERFNKAQNIIFPVLEKNGIPFTLSEETEKAIKGKDKNIHPRSFDIFVFGSDLQQIHTIFPCLVISKLEDDLGDVKPKNSVWLGIDSETVICFFEK